jgi:putative ABC transport system permease protein
MRYVLDKDLGFTAERVLVVENLERNAEKGRKLYDRFQQYAAGNSSIVSIAGTSASFGSNKGMGIGMEFNKKKIPLDFYVVDYNFLPVLDLKVLEGRNFSPRFSTDTDGQGVIINQTLAKLLGSDGKVGQKSKQLDQQIIGVVTDFHYLSLKHKIGPALIMLDPTVSSNYLVKLRAGNLSAIVSQLEKNWKQISDGQPFVYSFLEDDVATQYQEYTRWTGLLVVITFFAVFIACLGLFSLSGLNTVNRTKEIGIRKVLGASVSHIILLLNRDMVRLAALAFLLGVPLAWQLMQGWLEDFAYRVQIGWEVFIVAGLVGLLTALLAVSYHSLKASMANPVDSLRNE